MAPNFKTKLETHKGTVREDAWDFSRLVKLRGELSSETLASQSSLEPPTDLSMCFLYLLVCLTSVLAFYCFQERSPYRIHIT